MKRFETTLCTLVAGLLLVGCASLGTGDPVVVRAEDVQVNSLSFYQTAMEWHFANSTKESKQLYAAFEVFRTQFPKAWQTLSAALPAYKAGKAVLAADGSPSSIGSVLATVEKLLADIRAVWSPAPAGGISWMRSRSSSAYSASLRNSSHVLLRLAS